MWNFPFTPAAHAAMTPRARMHATLQGFAAPRTGVEVRGAAGNFEQLIKTAVNAPVVNDQLHPRGLYARAMPVGFDGQATKGLYARHVRTRPSESNVYGGHEVVRGGALAGFGVTSLLPNQGGLVPSTSRAIRPAPTSLTPPSFGPGPAPATVAPAGSSSAPAPVSTVAPPANVVPTPAAGNGGSAVYEEPPRALPAEGVTDTLARANPASTTTALPATAAPRSNLSFPLMLGGAAALIGAVWYFTKG